MNSYRLKSLVTCPVERSDGELLPFVGLEDVGSGTGALATDELPMKAALDSVLHRPGDVLFSKLRPYLAKSFMPTMPGSATGELLVLRPEREIDGRFLLYSTLSSPWLEWAETTSYGTKMPRTSWEAMSEYRLLLPSLDEQRRIADFLDAETVRIDSLTSVQRQTRTVLLERRAANVFAAVTGSSSADRGPSKLAWAESLPATWQSVKLGHFARMGSGHTPSRSHPEWWEDCTIPWITTGEVSQVRDDRREVLTETRERISEIGMVNSAAELHPKGTVVLCRTASAGYSAIMGEDMATSQDFVTWTCGPLVDPFYLLWCLRAMRSDLLGRLAMGSTHKTIYVPDLQMLRIPLPPIAEQQRIVTSIHAANTAIDAAVDVIDQQLALLAERRQALITAAVTGGITV